MPLIANATPCRHYFLLREMSYTHAATRCTPAVHGFSSLITLTDSAADILLTPCCCRLFFHAIDAAAALLLLMLTLPC